MPWRHNGLLGFIGRSRFRSSFAADTIGPFEVFHQIPETLLLAASEVLGLVFALAAAADKLPACQVLIAMNCQVLGLETVEEAMTVRATVQGIGSQWS